MSVELLSYLYDAAPVEIESLAERCRQRGYELRVLREFADWSRFRWVTTGTIEPEDTLCGWPTKSPFAASVAKAFDQRAASELEAHESAERLAAFEVELLDDPEEFNEALEDESEEYPDGYSAARSQSSACWYVRLAAGRGGLGEEFAEAVLECTLQLRGGIMDDPQECEFRTVERQADSAKAGRKPWWKLW